jgi:RHS repeat-associated protein
MGTEIGLDYFGERYFSSAQGRFTSPDALLAKKERVADPQRWNRYAYVRNNPLRYVDPNGEDFVIYYSVDGNISESDRKWFEAHKGEILAAIKVKYEKAGVKTSAYRTCRRCPIARERLWTRAPHLEFPGSNSPASGIIVRSLEGVLARQRPPHARLECYYSALTHIRTQGAIGCALRRISVRMGQGMVRACHMSPLKSKGMIGGNEP